MNVNDLFRAFAQRVSCAMGSKFAFGGALLGVVIWATLGPHYRYSDAWQLVINTTTTIITFLMVFLIQYTQNRDTRAVHVKLDELLRAVKDARESLIDIEDRPDEELDRVKAEQGAVARASHDDAPEPAHQPAGPSPV